MTRQIVWIDDDADDYPAVLAVLRRPQVTVTVCRSITEALASACNLASDDLIVLDLKLPPGDVLEAGGGDCAGLWLLETLRHVHHVGAPAIVFSMLSESIVADRRLELGICEFVRKSMGLHALADAIKRYTSSG